MRFKTIKLFKMYIGIYVHKVFSKIVIILFIVFSFNFRLITITKINKIFLYGLGKTREKFDSKHHRRKQGSMAGSVK